MKLYGGGTYFIAMYISSPITEMGVAHAFRALTVSM